MPIVAFSDLGDVLVDLSIEDIETAVFLNFMGFIYILLNSFFMLIYLILNILLFLHYLFFPCIHFSFDRCRGALGISIDQLNIWILPNCVHVIDIIQLKFVLQIKKRSIFLVSVGKFL
jgi:hypothetical protein